MMAEVIDALNLKDGSVVVDATLGDAGHSEEILKRIGVNGKLIGFDADAEAILRAKQYLHPYENQLTLVRNNFLDLKNILLGLKIQKVNAILFDLGWSTPQFNERGRGFSFMKDEPLDMRYDNNAVVKNEAGEKSSALTAAEILNSYSKDDLFKVLHLYAEEKFAKEIAAAIVEERKRKPIVKTGDLNNIILEVYRQKLHSSADVPWLGGHHPSTQTFQALRIEVNHELDVIKQVLPQAIEILEPGGRLAVITFHSVEDRLVKQFLKSQENKTVNLINKKPIVAGADEVGQNPSSRSAKLRVAQKL